MALLAPPLAPAPGQRDFAAATRCRGTVTQSWTQGGLGQRKQGDIPPFRESPAGCLSSWPWSPAGLAGCVVLTSWGSTS